MVSRLFCVAFNHLPVLCFVWLHWLPGSFWGGPYWFPVFYWWLSKFCLGFCVGRVQRDSRLSGGWSF